MLFRAPSHDLHTSPKVLHRQEWTWTRSAVTDTNPNPNPSPLLEPTPVSYLYALEVRWLPVSSSHGQLVTAQNRMAS